MAEVASINVNMFWFPPTYRTQLEIDVLHFSVHGSMVYYIHYCSMVYDFLCHVCGPLNRQLKKAKTHAHTNTNRGATSNEIETLNDARHTSAESKRGCCTLSAKLKVY